MQDYHYDVMNCRTPKEHFAEGGAVADEVYEGRPCLDCNDNCAGFVPHPWRKTCGSCKCTKDSHDVLHEEWVNVRDRLGFKPVQDPDKRVSKERSYSQGYSWVPPGLPSHKVEKYFNSLPSNKVPKLGTSGEKYRDKQVVVQLPKQDLALTYCKHVEQRHHQSYEDFINARNEIALDIGYARECTYHVECPKCKKNVEPGEIGVFASKFGDTVLWHPTCFTCTECQELLVDLTYCLYEDHLYCERHYAQQFKPRCSACDEIFGWKHSPTAEDSALHTPSQPKRYIRSLNV